LTAVEVGASGKAGLSFGLPKLLFQVKGAVVPESDGKKFLYLLQVGEESRPPITVIVNWVGQQN